MLQMQQVIIYDLKSYRRADQHYIGKADLTDEAIIELGRIFVKCFVKEMQEKQLQYRQDEFWMPPVKLLPEGFVIPFNEKTKAFYKLISDLAIKYAPYWDNQLRKYDEEKIQKDRETGILR